MGSAPTSTWYYADGVRSYVHRERGRGVPVYRERGEGCTRLQGERGEVASRPPYPGPCTWPYMAIWPYIQVILGCTWPYGPIYRVI